VAARYLAVPRPSLVGAKRLTVQAFDLGFEEFLREMDREMGSRSPRRSTWRHAARWTDRKRRG